MSVHQFSPLLALVAVCAVGATAPAEVTRNQAARMGVDVILIRGGGELRGCILSREEDGTLTIAVRREWLQNHQPQRLAEADERAAAQRLEAYRQLVDRIRDWLGDCADDQELSAILRRELEEYQGYVDDPDSIPKPKPSGFLLIDVATGDARRVYAQPAQRKQVALAAWQEEVLDVETSNVQELQERLTELSIDWQQVHVDLSDRLPGGMPQSDREWAARKAVYEFAFRKRVEFQGTGDMVFRTDADAKQPGLEQLLGGMLKGLNGGLNVDLDQLLGGNGPAGAGERPGWRESAIQSAEKAGVSGFRVTRVDTDLQNSSVAVETVFLARVAEGSWETIWRHQETLDARQDRKALADRIRQDPQVAESFKLLESLGLRDGVDQAVQFGAATMDAQQTADDRFFGFFDRYTQRLDGPPLRWDAPAHE